MSKQQTLLKFILNTYVDIIIRVTKINEFVMTKVYVFRGS